MTPLKASTTSFGFSVSPQVFHSRKSRFTFFSSCPEFTNDTRVTKYSSALKFSSLWSFWDPSQLQRTPPTLRLLCHSPARHPESWRGGASARSGLYKPLSTFTPPTTQALVFRGASGPSPVPPPPRSGRPGPQHKSPTAALGGGGG